MPSASTASLNGLDDIGLTLTARRRDPHVRDEATGRAAVARASDSGRPCRDTAATDVAAVAGASEARARAKDADENRDPSRRRHRSRDRRRGGQACSTLLRREGLPIETETAPIGGAGYDAAGQPLPDATLRARARRRRRAAGRGRRAALRRRCRARCGPSRASLGIRKALGLVRQLCARRCSIRSSPRASTLKPGRGRRTRSDDRPRADRRHLFRRAARTPPQRRRRARGLRHDALQRARDPPHRARRLRDRARRGQQAVLGRQGQRARHVSSLWREVVTDDRRKDYPDVALDAHVRRQRRDAARRATRSSST